MSRWIRTACVAGMLVAGLAAPSGAQAELLEGELTVYGMTCPFCAFGIEKKLRAVEGVSEVKVELDEGRIQLGFSPSNDAGPGALGDAVEEAGFELSAIRLKVGGTLAEDGGRPVLASGKEVRFLLVDAESREPLAGSALETLRTRAAGGRLVVSGAVDRKYDGLPALLLRAPGAP